MIKEFLRKLIGDEVVNNGGGTDPTRYHVSPTQLAAVHRCVSVISDTVAQMDLQVIERGGSKIDHEYNFMLSSEPNPLMSRFMVMKNLVQDILLHGNGYLLVSRTYTGVLGLYYVPCFDVAITWDGDFNSIPEYYVTGHGQVDIFDIIHVKNYTTDGVNGISVISAAASATTIAAAGEGQAHDFFNGGSNASAVISSPRMLTKDQQIEAKQAFQDVAKGGLGVLSGDMKYQQLSINPKDSQLLESRKFSGEEICRFFGVNPIKAYYEKGSYNSAQAAAEEFLQDTIQPLLDKIASEITRKIFLRKDRLKLAVEFNTNDYLRIDKKKEASYFSQLYNMGVMTTNEVRSEVGLPPVKDGDLPRVQTNTVPINWQVSDETDNNFKKG